MKCQEKSQYPSKRRADMAARKRERDNRTLQLRAYRCPICGLWHLTHVPDKDEREEAS